MAGMPAILRVDIIANAAKARAEMSETESSADRMRGTMLKVGAAIGGAFAVNKVVEFANGAISAASDLNENLSKTTAVFGDWAIDVEQFAEKAAKSVGLSRNAALEATSNFGNMFKQMGLGNGDALDLSTGMVKLAADFASFHNADISDVLAAQQSAFRGEFDALQRFVPMINAATVEQKALEMTGKKTTKELTAQEKALATNAIMFEQAGAAQGDFAKTSDGLANKTRIQQAQWEDMQATIGQKLLPVQLALTTFLSEKLIPVMTSLANWLGDNKEVLLALAIGITAALVPALIAWLAAVIPVAIATVAAAAPVIALGIAVGALALLIVKNWDTITDAFRAALDWLGRNWPLVLTILTGPFGLAVKLIVDHWDSIKQAFAAALDWISDRIRGFVGFFREMIDSVKRIAGDIAEAVKAPFNAVIRTWNDFHLTMPKIETPLGDIGGQRIDFPNLPELARGGSVLRSGLAVVHRGETFSGVGGSLGGSTVINVHVTTTGLGADAPELQRAVVNALRGYVARNGAVSLPITAA
ncbi:MAG: hypothetical protein ABWY50_06960 [Aeromicrobium sp.]